MTDVSESSWYEKIVKICKKLDFSIEVGSEPLVVPQRPEGTAYDPPVCIMRSSVKIVYPTGNYNEHEVPIMTQCVFVGTGVKDWGNHINPPEQAPDYGWIIEGAEKRAIENASKRAVQRFGDD